MRDDMFKVIVERPRWGSRHASSPKLKLNTDPDRKSIGLRRHVWEAAPYAKSLSENLSPLRRYLWKQRGRLWNDVFADVCKKLDTGSTVKMHIREHLEDFVMIRIHVESYGVFLGQSRGGVAMPFPRWWPMLYVDPHDGLLKESASLAKQLGTPYVRRFCRAPCWPVPSPNQFRKQSPTQCLMNLKGLWFEISLDRAPNCDDPQLFAELSDGTWREREGWSVVTKRQLSKRALKSLRLTNDGETGHD